MSESVQRGDDLTKAFAQLVAQSRPGGEVVQEIDMGFRPREPQRWMFSLLQQNPRCCVVAHRRMGKTYGLVAWMFAKALAGAKDKARDGTKRDWGATPAKYMFIAPTREQAKNVAWQYITDFAGKIPGAEVRKSENRVVLPNGASIMLGGASEPDSLRGMYLDGVVFDEFALMSIYVWQGVVSQQLSDFDGWAVFSATPMGRNAFYRFYTEAERREGWGRIRLPASKTGLFTPEQLMKIKAQDGLDDAAFKREYECDFFAPVPGTFYGEYIERLRENGQICRVPHNPSLPVFTSWDIGTRHPTAIWFFQIPSPGVINVIRCFSKVNQSPTKLRDYLNGLDYHFKVHILPHDSAHQRFGYQDGADIRQQLEDQGIYPTHILARAGKEHGRSLVRQILPICYFDEKNTMQGIDALALHRREFNEATEQYTLNDKEDWTSDLADAFRYGATYLSEQTATNIGRDTHSASAGLAIGGGRAMTRQRPNHTGLPQVLLQKPGGSVRHLPTGGMFTGRHNRH